MGPISGSRQNWQVIFMGNASYGPKETSRFGFFTILNYLLSYFITAFCEGLDNKEKKATFSSHMG